MTQKFPKSLPLKKKKQKEKIFECKSNVQQLNNSTFFKVFYCTKIALFISHK